MSSRSKRTSTLRGALFIIMVSLVVTVTACGSPNGQPPGEEPLSPATSASPVEETSENPEDQCEEGTQPTGDGAGPSSPSSNSEQTQSSKNPSAHECAGEVPEDLTEDEMRSAEPAPMPVDP